jgi:hypothetical protein
MLILENMNSQWEFMLTKATKSTVYGVAMAFHGSGWFMLQKMQEQDVLIAGLKCSYKPVVNS